REFFDQEAALERTALQQAEERLRQTEQKTALISPEGQASQAVQAISRFHTEIGARNAQLQASRTYAADSNPEVVRSQAEIDALERQLRISQQGDPQRLPGDVQVPAGHLADALLQYRQALRSFTEHDKFFASLQS